MQNTMARLIRDTHFRHRALLYLPNEHLVGIRRLFLYSLAGADEEEEECLFPETDDDELMPDPIEIPISWASAFSCEIPRPTFMRGEEKPENQSRPWVRLLHGAKSTEADVVRNMAAHINGPPFDKVLGTGTLAVPKTYLRLYVSSTSIDKGWRRFWYRHYRSKRIPSLGFVDYDRIYETEEIPEKRDEALELYMQLVEHRKRIEEINERLDVLDPDNAIEEYHNDISQRMLKNK